MRPRAGRGGGLTLIEVLVVLAILAILAAIVYPVFITARRRAYELDCTQHLRQIGTAVALYLEDHDGRRPLRLSDLHPLHLTKPSVLTCRADAWRDAGGWAWRRCGAAGGDKPWPVAQSYGYFFDGRTSDDGVWEHLAAQAGRPGYAVCVVHGRPAAPNSLDYRGLGLRLCFDGAVYRFQNTREFDPWWLCTGG